MHGEVGSLSRMVKEKSKLDGSGTEQSWIADFIEARLSLQARTMMRLAVSCMEEDRDRRPTMENVAQMLV